jgi:hypothetical protein
VPIQVNVAVDQAGQDKLSRGVDVLIGWRQILFGADGDDFFPQRWRWNFRTPETM